MFDRIRMRRGDERGITALETAIILIAFVVVASVFAFTILSSGTYTTDRSKEAIYAGLAEVRGSLEQKGSVIATSDGTSTITNVVFTVGVVAGGEAVDFTIGANAVVRIEYRDSNERVEITNWTKSFIGYDDGDDLLEVRELVEITVPITGNVSTLGINTTFAVEVKPPVGAVLLIERTMPAVLDEVMDLH